MRSERLPFPGRRAAAALVLGAFAGGAFAEGPNDNYWGELEYFYPTISSTARLDFPGTNLPGTTVSLEDDLGLTDRKGTPYLLLGGRLGQNWRIEFEFYKLQRRATRTITRDITWGDVTYPASADITSHFDTDVYRLVGEYSFYRTPVAEFGGSLGLHVTNFKIGLSGQGNGPEGLTVQSEQRSALAPLPTLGLYGSYEWGGQWIARGRLDYLSLNIDQYDGQLTNALASISWRFHKNWGIGTGYRYVDYKLGVSKSNFHGEVNYEFKGPTLFVEGAF